MGGTALKLLSSAWAGGRLWKVKLAKKTEATRESLKFNKTALKTSVDKLMDISKNYEGSDSVTALGKILD